MIEMMRFCIVANIIFIFMSIYFAFSLNRIKYICVFLHDELIKQSLQKDLQGDNKFSVKTPI